MMSKKSTKVSEKLFIAIDTELSLEEGVVIATGPLNEVLEAVNQHLDIEHITTEDAYDRILIYELGERRNFGFETRCFILPADK